jgi:dTDP-4-amino-4,6-dideoxygalactose transaminase
MWECYYTELLDLSQSGKISLPHIPEYATNNGHMFYIICLSLEQRINLVKKLKENGIMAVFHYISLHSSEYYKDKYIGNELLESDRYTDCLLRLPMYYELTNDEIKSVATIIKNAI